MLTGCAIAQCCARALQIGKASAVVFLLCLSCHCDVNLEMFALATIVTNATALQSCSADLQQLVPVSQGSHLNTAIGTDQMEGVELLLTGLYGLQRNIQDIITQDNDLDSDVGMNLIQLLGGSNDFYGTKRRRNSCTSASSNDSILSGRCTLTPLPNRPSCGPLFVHMLAVLQS